MLYADQTFTEEEILLDGHRFERCVFRDCVLRFHGTAPTQLADCRDEGQVQWLVNGHAAVTLDFLQALGQGGGQGAREMLLNLLDEVREGRWAPQSPL